MARQQTGTTDQPEMGIVCTRFWHRLDQRGLCFVRARQNDEIVLTTYGRSSGFCVDPIEKKPLNHFLPGTAVLSFGTAGCNLACKFCQNWDISKSRENDKLQASASPEAIAEAALETGSRSVAFTYNDPVIFLEYADDVAIACRERDIKTVAVTAGYITEEPREEFFRYMDAANVDLKAFTERFYWKVCGGHLAPVLESIEYLRHETDVWFEITNLLIPGENDSEAEIDEMTQWIMEQLGPNVPLHFTAFHPDWKMTSHQNAPLQTLTRSRDIALKNGLRYVYTGNVRDLRGSSTYCHACGEILIGRDGYQLSTWNMAVENERASCGSCGTPVAGVYDSAPGQWGARRLPLLWRDDHHPGHCDSRNSCIPLL
jgi:pyruvate formate lyase activating enzyme